MIESTYMRIQTLVLVMAAVVLVGAPGVGAAQSSRIETRTRLVSQFSTLQTQWLEAIKKKDTAALDRLLSEDFEIWTPAHSGPLPREDWQTQAFAEDLKTYRVTGMAVKSPRDGVAVESFRLVTTTSVDGEDVTQQFFVVNLWVSEKDSWRCTDSYLSRVAAGPTSAPTMPTGKD